jgi:sporulation protein YlmC with PRC-barrel domain
MLGSIQPTSIQERTTIMKTNTLPLLTSALVVACSIQYNAQGAPPSTQKLAPVTVHGQRPGMQKANGEVDTPKSTFAELIESGVYNYQNERLGHIKDVTADLEQGRLVEVLVSTRSGTFGMHEKITAVPPTMLKFDTVNNVTRINVSKARFDAAPALGRANPATYSQTDRAVASSRYFGVKPWFERGQLGFVQTTAALDLMQIKNPQGNYMGKVGLILMDLPSARIRQIIDDTVTMHGDGSHVLAPTALRYNAAHTGLVLNEQFSTLNNSPHFRWINGNGGDTQYVEQTNASAVNSPAMRRSVTPTKVASRHNRTRNLAAE